MRRIHRELIDKMMAVRIATASRAAWRVRQLVGSQDERVALAACRLALAPFADIDLTRPDSIAGCYPQEEDDEPAVRKSDVQIMQELLGRQLESNG